VRFWMRFRRYWNLMSKAHPDQDGSNYFRQETQHGQGLTDVAVSSGAFWCGSLTHINDESAIIRYRNRKPPTAMTDVNCSSIGRCYSGIKRAAARFTVLCKPCADIRTAWQGGHFVPRCIPRSRESFTTPAPPRGGGIGAAQRRLCLCDSVRRSEEPHTRPFRLDLTRGLSRPLDPRPGVSLLDLDQPSGWTALGLVPPLNRAGLCGACQRKRKRHGRQRQTAAHPPISRPMDRRGV
jgi:hypothetical protein